MWTLVVERGPAAALWLLALAAQMSGWTSTAIALALVGGAIFFLVAPACHHAGAWHTRRLESGRKSVEPAHLIIVGLAGVIVFAVIALGGVIWQQVRESPANGPVSGALTSTAAPAKTSAPKRFYSKQAKEDYASALYELKKVFTTADAKILDIFQNGFLDWRSAGRPLDYVALYGQLDVMKNALGDLADGLFDKNSVTKKYPSAADLLNAIVKPDDRHYLQDLEEARQRFKDAAEFLQKTIKDPKEAEQVRKKIFEVHYESMNQRFFALRAWIQSSEKAIDAEQDALGQ